jgi:hypothetical protein
MSNYCVSCGTLLASQSNFCQKCGHSISNSFAPSVTNTKQQSSSRDEQERKKISPLKRNLIFGVIFTLVLAAAVNGLRWAEERDACSAIPVILGPVNEGPASVEEFRDTWAVMDSLAEEVENLELKTAIRNFSSAGKTMLCETLSTGGSAPAAEAAYRTKADELAVLCESFF